MSDKNTTDLAVQKARLQELLRAKKAADALRDWEAKTKARNPAYVVGSIRPATDAEVVAGGGGSTARREERWRT